MRKLDLKMESRTPECLTCPTSQSRSSATHPPSSARDGTASQCDPVIHSQYLVLAAANAARHQRAPLALGPRDYALGSTRSLSLHPSHFTNLPAGSQLLASRGVGSHAIVHTNSTIQNHHSDLMNRGPIPRYLRKPNCSYNNLIAMAILANGSDSMPVSEIYKYIEQEFPYFVTAAPDGWKNSVRHSLSLGQYFRKVERTPSSGWHGKKGFHWEIVPGKNETLRTEVEKYLREEGRGLVENRTAKAGLGIASGRVQATVVMNPSGSQNQTIIHRPFSSHGGNVPASRSFISNYGVYPSTGQLTTSPSARLLLSSASPIVPVRSVNARGTTTHGNSRISTLTLSSAPRPITAPCSQTADQSFFSFSTHSQPSPGALSSSSKTCEELVRIALSGLPQSRIRVDPNVLKELGMDASISTEAFASSLLDKPVGAELQGGGLKDTSPPSVSGSITHCSNATSPRLFPPRPSVQPTTVGSLHVALTSGQRQCSLQPNTVPSEINRGVLQRTTSLQSCPCCGYIADKPELQGEMPTSNWSHFRTEQEITSPFMCPTHTRPEPTLNQIIHGFPTSSSSSMHLSGYSKNYYKAFWMPGQTAAVRSLETQRKHKRPLNCSPQVKRSPLDEQFMAAITPCFASEVYRLGNVDRLAVPKPEERRENRSDRKGSRKEDRLTEQPTNGTSSTGGKEKDGETEDGDLGAKHGPKRLQQNICIPLNKVVLKSDKGLTSCRKRTCEPDDTHPAPKQMKVSKEVPTGNDNLTADEFFASIFGHGKGGQRETNELSSPLPRSFTANDDIVAGRSFYERDQEFTRLLSSSEMEEAYQCFQVGSSADCKSDWLSLDQ